MVKTSFKILFLTLVVVLVAYWYNPSFTQVKLSPVVETKSGKLQGIISTSRNGKEYYEYLGIPYAAPPVGEKRFEPPGPPIKWTGVRAVNAFGEKCLQLEMITSRLTGSEDCLFLNIFAPKKSHSSLLPVMVFIHGGAFVTGSSNAYGAKYFMDQDVILVTVNYRLAALGFLSTGDGVIRGNNGLKDQNRALMYIKGNIKAFGGDPNKVTLFGESAGAASVQYHILSLLSKGLFSKAIAQSGTAINHWGLYNNPKEQAQRFAAKFNCNFTDTKAIAACLKKVDATTFVREHMEMTVPLRDPITIFTPTIEYFKDNNAFLVEHPMKILQSGTFNKVPLISGVNSEEGLLSAAVITSNQTKMDEANNNWNWWVSRILNLPQDDAIAQQIRHFYFGSNKNIASKDYLRSYTNMFSDRMFFWATHTQAKLYAPHASIRLYYYTHQGDFSLANVMAATQGRFPVIINLVWDAFSRWFNSYFFKYSPPHMGVCHADEIPLLFNFNIALGSEIPPGDKDYDLSVSMVKLWTTFASVDNSETIKFKNDVWLPISKYDTTLKYLRIDADSALIDEPFIERVKFWDELNIQKV